MVDSILTNQAPIVTRPAENKSVSASAVSNASSVPESEVAEQIIDVTPRAMDSDANASFSDRGSPDLRPPLKNFLTDSVDLRPSLENFKPMELSSEEALESRVIDLEIGSNEDVDETSSSVNVNNKAIEAFVEPREQLQRSVNATA